MDKEKKYKELKRNFFKEKRRAAEIQKKIDLLEKSLPNLYKLEDELNELSHKYRRGQLVVLKGRNEIAKITRLIGRKHYKVFAQCEGLRTGVGTSEKIHETAILCEVERLVLSKCIWDISGLPEDPREQKKQKLKEGDSSPN